MSTRLRILAVGVLATVGLFGGAASAQAAPAGHRTAQPASGCGWRVNADAVNIRTGPSTRNTSVGQATRGTILSGTCMGEKGGHYSDCGGGDMWAAINYNDKLRYVAEACVSLA